MLPYYTRAAHCKCVSASTSEADIHFAVNSRGGCTLCEQTGRTYSQFYCVIAFIVLLFIIAGMQNHSTNAELQIIRELFCHTSSERKYYFYKV